MKNHVVESYENYREEDRLTTNNARRIEFLTTVRVLEGLFDGSEKILDCAAGTGVYAFHFADRGHAVTAADITPRHIDIIRETLKTKPYDMETAVLNAVDMSIFGDESFDAVLNMGPFYHLIDSADREKCLRECRRVLKKGGLLITAYIPRFYLYQYIAMQDEKYLDERLARQITETGALRHDDEKCFWTDTYYSTADEMEALYRAHGFEVTDHFAQDGLTPQFAEIADKWDEEKFKIWCGYHYSVCREKSLLGASNHVVIIGKNCENGGIPMEKQYLIRNAEARDHAEIAELFRSDLGYDCTDELVERKLSAIDNDRESVFVAELDGEVVGVVHVERYDLLYFEMMANILGLAVKSEYRHIGIGSDLMNTAEKWASDIGAVSVRLSSGGMRLGAHEFYRAIGYSTEKPQIRFTKNIR